VDLFLNKEVQLFVELLHETSAGGDRVILEILLAVSNICVAVEFCYEVFVLLSASKAARTLVIHLASRGNSVKRHHHHFLWLKHIDNLVDVVEDLDPNLFQFFGHQLRFEDD
jgi:hypothetical protein